MALELTALPAPDVLETLDYDTILTDLLSRMRTINPNYTNLVEGDPAYSVLQTNAYESVMLRKRVNDAVRAVLATHAIGSDLDNLAALFSLLRDGKTDKAFRPEVLNYLKTISPGSPEWYRKYALEANDPPKGESLLTGDKIVEARAFKTCTPGQVLVFVQPDTPGAIAVGDVPGQVQEYLREEPHLFMGDTVTVRTIDKKDYALTARIRVVPGFSVADVLSTVQKQANAFVRERKIIGREIPLSDIYATFASDAISEFRLVSPAASITPRPGGITDMAVSTFIKDTASTDWTNWPEDNTEKPGAWSLDPPDVGLH